MTNTQALRDKIEHLANSANALLTEKGAVPWTKEEQASFDNIADEIESHQKQLKAIERLRDLEADKFFNTAAKPVKSDGEVIGAVQAVALYLRNGKNVKRLRFTMPCRPQRQARVAIRFRQRLRPW